MTEEVQFLINTLRATNDKLRECWLWKGYLDNGEYDLAEEKEPEDIFDIIFENNQLLYRYANNLNIPALSLEA